MLGGIDSGLAGVSLAGWAQPISAPDAQAAPTGDLGVAAATPISFDLNRTAVNRLVATENIDLAQIAAQVAAPDLNLGVATEPGAVDRFKEAANAIRYAIGDLSGLFPDRTEQVQDGSPAQVVSLQVEALTSAIASLMYPVAGQAPGQLGTRLELQAALDFVKMTFAKDEQGKLKTVTRDNARQVLEQAAGKLGLTLESRTVDGLTGWAVTGMGSTLAVATEPGPVDRFKEAANAVRYAIRDLGGLFPDRSEQLQDGSPALAVSLQLEALTSAIASLTYPVAGQVPGQLGNRADLLAALEFVKSTFAKDDQGKLKTVTRDNARQVLEQAASKLGLTLESRTVDGLTGWAATRAGNTLGLATEPPAEARFKEAANAVRYAIRDLGSLFPDRSEQLQGGSPALAVSLQLEALTSAIASLTYPMSGQEAGQLGSRADLLAALDFVKSTFAKDDQGKLKTVTRDNARQVLEQAAGKLGLTLESRTVDGLTGWAVTRAGNTLGLATEPPAEDRFKEAANAVRYAIRDLGSLFPDRSEQLQDGSPAQAVSLQMEALNSAIATLMYPVSGQMAGQLGSRADLLAALDFVKTTFAKDDQGKLKTVTRDNARQVLEQAAGKLGLTLESRTVDGLSGYAVTRGGQTLGVATEPPATERFKEAANAVRYAIRDVGGLFPDRVEQLQDGSPAQAVTLQLDALTSAIASMMYPVSGQEVGQLGNRADLIAALDFVKTTFAKDDQGKLKTVTRDNARQVLEQAAGKLGLTLESRMVDGLTGWAVTRGGTTVAVATEPDSVARFKEAANATRYAIRDLGSLFPDRTEQLQDGSSAQSVVLKLEALASAIAALTYPPAGGEPGKLAMRADLIAALEFVKSMFAKDDQAKLKNVTRDNASQVLDQAASKLGLRLESRTMDGQTGWVVVRR
jgi:hypothetical protein